MKQWLKKLPAWLALICLIMVTGHVQTASGGQNTANGEIYLDIATMETRPVSNDRLLYMALNSIGCYASFTMTPMENGVETADSNVMDGVVVSTPDLEKKYPNLVKVNVPLETAHILAIVREGTDFTASGWQDLENADVGVNSQRQYLLSLIPQSAKVQEYDEAQRVLEGLLNGEYDVAVISRRAHETLIIPEGLTIAGELDRLTDYLYLNKKHSELIPSAEKAIKKLFENETAELILNDMPVPELNERQTILHLISANFEISREVAFNDILRKNFEDDVNVEWYTFAMNYRRYSREKNRLASIAGLIRQDIAARNISAIIVSGEEALEFVKRYYYLYFRNVPVFSYGVGGNIEALTKGFEEFFTGIYEEPAVYETVDTALKLFPETKKIFVLNDYTSEGAVYRDEIEKQLKPFTEAGIIETEYSKDKPVADIMETIKNLPPDSLVLVGSYFIDLNGLYHPLNDMKRMLERNCSVPIITFHSTNLEYGALGGKCLDYEEYAEGITEMLREVLDGACASGLPVVRDAGRFSRWVFDYNKLKQFGKGIENLPPGAVIYNKPVRIWESDPRFFITVLATLLTGIAAAIIISFLVIRSRKQNELLQKDEKLKEVKERLERIIYSAPVMIGISSGGFVVEINDNMRNAFGLEEGSCVSIIYPDENQHAERIARVRRDGYAPKEILPFRFKDGSIRRCITSTVSVEYDGKEALVLWAVDMEDNELRKDMLDMARENLQAIVDMMPAPVGITDRKTRRLLYGNDAYVKYMEFPSGNALIGTDICTLFAPEQFGGETIESLCEMLVSCNHPSTVEARRLTKKGNIVEARISTHPINYYGRSAKLSIMTDLTTEREYRSMQENLQMILDVMPVAVSLVDMEKREMLYANNESYGLFMYDKDNSSGSVPITQFLPGDLDTEKQEVLLSKIFSLGKGDSMEATLLKGDGTLLEARITTSHILYKGKETILLVFRDMSVERRNKLIRNSLQTVLDMLPIPIRIVDLEDYTLTYINKATVELFGMSSVEENLGKPAVDYMPSVQPSGKDSMEVLMGTFGTGLTEVVASRSDGKPLELLVTSCNIVYNGRLSSLAVVQDLEAEKEYQRMILSTAEKEKEANLLKSRFLVNMSHEIRTPMNAIIGLTEIELRKEQEKNTKTIYKKINTSAKNLLEIINDILDLSKIEADKMVLFEDEFELEEVINSALLVASPRLDGKNVEFMLDAALDLPRYVVGDRTRLWQILKNFLDNSAKYTEKGKISLTVRAGEYDDEKIILNFMIEDTGIGISKEQQKRLFDPYEQVHNEAQKRYSGTGLGMAISKQLCEIMGGEMSLESTSGIGTKIILKLPFGRSLNTETELEAVRSKAGSGALEGMEILAVDDDKLSLEIMDRLLVSGGASCILAKSGLEAMEIILEKRDKGESFDLILLDYMMEGLNGLETARQIHLALSKAPKLLMVTSYQKLLLKSELEKNGIDDVIEKPFIPTQFISRLASALGGTETEVETMRQYTGYTGVKVLLFEDYRLNQEVALGMMEQFGITAEIAENGSIGVDILKNGGQFDLIFMDLQMPVMDGYEATKIIRADSRFDDIPIVSLTADAMKEVAQKCLELGMNDHISKPIEFDSLNRVFLKWLPESKRDPKYKQVVTDDAVGGRYDEVLARFSGNRALYKKALFEFAELLPEKWKSFFEILSNMKVTELFVHKLKGAAGNLSEYEIFDSAAAFEQSIRDGRPSEALYNHLTAVCNIVKQRIAGDSDKNKDMEKEEGSIEEYRGIISRLSDALSDFDPRASGEAINDLAEKDWPFANVSEIKKLIELARKYEFDTAMGMIDSMIV